MHADQIIATLELKPQDPRYQDDLVQKLIAPQYPHAQKTTLFLGLPSVSTSYKASSKLPLAR
jgi:hypothetical protein